MKTLLKIVGALVAVLLLAVGGFAASIALTGIPKYPPPPKYALKVEPTPERIARGKKLAGLLCAECHADPSTQALTGRPLHDLPAQFGKAWSRNITHDTADGIGNWTDGEIYTLLRTGLKPDGTYLPPWMVKLPHLADEDLISVIAYLRSDDPRVAARKGRLPETQPSFFAKLLTRVAFKPLPMPTAPIPMPDKNDPIALGKYLATGALDCYQCHSKDFATNDGFVPEKSVGFFGGGNQMPDVTGRLITTANLTPDPESGLGRWSEADFRRAVREGFRPDHRPLRQPMARMPELTDDEANAIFAYLRTVPAIHNEVKRSDDFVLPATASAGEKVYAKYSCASCHGLSGEGLCDLRQANQKYKTDAELTDWIKDASKKNPDTKMPTWAGTIEEAEYAPLVEYVRLLGKRWESSAQTAAN
ncbi:MAG: c-type cytochrome [Deltaproteobacteria bacterium]|nr:c-type cytochrome [Deltaproteobacteria bacterium]